MKEICRDSKEMAHHRCVPHFKGKLSPHLKEIKRLYSMQSLNRWFKACSRSDSPADFSSSCQQISLPKTSKPRFTFARPSIVFSFLSPFFYKSAFCLSSLTASLCLGSSYLQRVNLHAKKPKNLSVTILTFFLALKERSSSIALHFLASKIERRWSALFIPVYLKLLSNSNILL